MQTLKVGQMLNDEIVNCYFESLQRRDEHLHRTNIIPKSSRFFSSFFYKKMMENNKYNYKNVERWTRKYDVFMHGKIYLSQSMLSLFTGCLLL
mmetsp:Transcript_10330/g.19305  ORF Transcript_10330/g.19305 Transcript_10330/m.19305 type:complete len:93 (+) Transcript_10330:325-603(+)